jgi:hypothetical protein
VIYASMWQRVRRKWSDPRVEPGYGEGGIMKTTDGGKTWTDASAGLPAPEFRGRIGIDIARSNPNVSTPSSTTTSRRVRRKEGERDAYGRPVFEPRIKAPRSTGPTTGQELAQGQPVGRVHALDGTPAPTAGSSARSASIPTDENTIYTLGVPLTVSRDGGKTINADRPRASTSIITASGSTRRTRGSSTTRTTAASTGRRRRQDLAVRRPLAAGAQFYNVGSTPARHRGSTDRSRTTAASAGGSI